MKRTIVALAAALVLAGGALAGEGGPSATGGSHLVAHDVFGLSTTRAAELQLQRAARRRLVHVSRRRGRHAVLGEGPVTCLTVIGKDAWIGGVIEHSNDPTVAGL